MTDRIQKEIEHKQQEWLRDQEETYRKQKESLTFMSTEYEKMKREVDSIQKQYENAQKELYQVKTKVEDNEATKQSQLDLLNDENTKCINKILSLESEIVSVNTMN
jgi:predicted  nucleic acid-binding Zn-ribbon protein